MKLNWQVNQVFIRRFVQQLDREEQGDDDRTGGGLWGGQGRGLTQAEFQWSGALQELQCAPVSFAGYFPRG